MQHRFKIGDQEYIAVTAKVNRLSTVAFAERSFIFDEPVIDKYEFLFVWPNCTEEQAAMVVESEILQLQSPDSYYFQKIFFKDYNANDGRFCINTAKESFASAMERERLYTVNPYGPEIPNKKGEEIYAFEYDEKMQENKSWQAAEQCRSDLRLILKVLKP